MLPAKIIQRIPRRVDLASKYPATCLKFSFIIAILIFFQPLLAQKATRKMNIMEMPDVEAFLKVNQKTLGAVSVVVYKDTIVYSKSNNDYFNSRTQAPVPGISKWFTAAVVLALVDEGKLKLDDPVSKYLPVMNKYMKSYITIRMCLAHTTGVENNKGFLSSGKKKYDMLEDEVNAYASREISNNAGEAFWYGDIGPNIAGRVVEIVTKKSFDRVAQEKIFRPLKMRATSFTDFEGKAINPAGGAQTTANDLINFLSMLLNKGEFEGKRILSEQSVAEMMKAQFAGLPVRYTPEGTEGLHHGLGVWLKEEDANGNGIVVSGLDAYGSYVYLDNCRKYAAVLLTQKPLKESKKDLGKEFRDLVEGMMGECR